MAVEYQGPGRAIRANPHVIVKPGEEAVIALESDSTNGVEIRIVAERQSTSPSDQN